MKTRTTIYALFGVIILQGCSGSSVIYDYDKSAPFDSYKTYSIFTPNPNDFETVSPIDPYHLESIEDAIRQEMTKKNYVLSEEPDLVITYHVVEKQKQRAKSTSVSVGVGTGGYYGGMGVSTGTTNIKYIDYSEGTLILDFIDADQNKLVWHGAATRTIEENDRKITQKIFSAVSEIFYNYKFKVSSN